MQRFMAGLADILDGVAALFALGAILFFLANFGGVETGPEFIQIAVFSLLIAVIPYCLAGAIHRIYTRL